MGFLSSLALLGTVAATPLAIVDVSVIHPGKDFAVPNQTVVIERGKFSAIGPSNKTQIPADAKRIDGKGKFLIPGLWDMHVHWYEEKSLGLFTANGVVGVRQMYGTRDHLVWRKRAEEGSMIGPRWIVGSPIVDGSPALWQGSIELKSPVEAKGLVSKLKSEGWDFIKVYEFLDAESYRSLAKEARLQKMPFEGHLPMAINLLEAGMSGQRTIEHLGNVMQSCTPRESEFRAMIQKAVSAPFRDSALDAGYEEFIGKYPNNRMDTLIGIDLFKKLAKTGTWQCPTLVVLRSLASLDQKEFTQDPRLKYMDADTRDRWNPANDFRLKERTMQDYENARYDYMRKFSLVRMLADTSNRFLAGTDCLNPYCFPGFSLHDELELLKQAGLTPAQALEAATLNPARYAGQEQHWGSIEKGKLADAVLLEANPLLDIRNTKRILGVIQGGRHFDRAALDQLLKSNEHPMP